MSRFGAPLAAEAQPQADASASVAPAPIVADDAPKRAVDYSSLMAQPPTSGAAVPDSAATASSPSSASSSIGAITPGAAAALASIAALSGGGGGGYTAGAAFNSMAGQPGQLGGYDAKKAQLEQKKKLLWGRKKQEVQTIEAMQAASGTGLAAHQNKQQWRAADFGGNAAEKAKFLKMMGDKQGATAAEDEATRLRQAQQAELERRDQLHEGNLGDVGASAAVR